MSAARYSRARSCSSPSSWTPRRPGCWYLAESAFPAPDADIDELTEATARGRVFAGYAGWGEGQLDAEVDQGDWIAHSAVPDDVFTEVPDELWSSVLTRKGGSYALIARMPSDSERQLTRITRNAQSSPAGRQPTASTC